jgi:hypothetical protein
MSQIGPVRQAKGTRTDKKFRFAARTIMLTYSQVSKFFLFLELF